MWPRKASAPLQPNPTASPRSARPLRQWAAIFAMAALLPAACALAEDPVTPITKASVPEQNVTLSELFDKGGVLMYPLAFMSFLALAIIVYLFIVLREEQVVPRTLRREIMARLRTGTLRDVRAACAETPCPLAEITVAGLDYLETEDVNSSMLKEMIEDEGARQAIAVQGQSQYLMDVAVIAPMVGLLGTVFGMIKAFNVVSLDLAKAKPMLLAGGVAEALITTAAGLIIGIPAMAFYAYFRGRSTKLVSRLESVSTEVLTLLLRKVQP
jgi:biopolymer transport protein ExbB